MVEANPALACAADAFEPIGLKDMQAVALLDRIDTKYVLTEAQLLTVLHDMRQDYRMLVVNDRRLSHYRTLYFDTPVFDLYTAHANGRGDRYKVRAREYVDSNVAFFEVKHKTHKDRTIKDRMATGQVVERITPEVAAWLRDVAPLDGDALEPKLWNTFQRMTLVSMRHGERITLDVDLAFYTQGRMAQLDGIAIVEAKRAAGRAASPFLTRMQAMRIRKHSFSKYSIGVGLLVDSVKKNALKEKLLWLQKALGQVQRTFITAPCAPRGQGRTS